MNTEAVLAAIVPAVAPLIKGLIEAVAAAEGATLYDLEAQTHAVLPQIGQVLLQALVEGQAAAVLGADGACACGGQPQAQGEPRPLRVDTSLGEIRFDRRVAYQCSICGARRYPVDEQLGLGLAGRMSRYQQEQIGWLLALLPVRLARQTLQRFNWPTLSASSVREHGEALGAELEAGLQEQMAAAAAGSAVALRQAPAGERLYAAPDGMMYCTTDRDEQTGRAQWRELKVAAVYEAEADVVAEAPSAATPVEAVPVRQRIQQWLGRTQPDVSAEAPDHAVRVTYVAETGPWEQFGQRLWSELHARGLGRPVVDLAVVADGSTHIDQAVDSALRVPEVGVTRILDIAHAQQHLWDVSKAAFGEGSRTGIAWVQAPLRALERGDLRALCQSLEAVAAAHELTAPTVATLARKTQTYFTQRAAQVAYPRFVAAGYQIGSGLAESACKRFGTDRMKGAGMRWTVAGAQQVATLRMFLLSDRWDEVSAHCRKPAA
jgi:hypothetical protein